MARKFNFNQEEYIKPVKETTLDVQAMIRNQRQSDSGMPSITFKRGGILMHPNEVKRFDFEGKLDNVILKREFDRIRQQNEVEKWKYKLDDYEAFQCVRLESLTKEFSKNPSPKDPFVEVLSKLTKSPREDKASVESAIDLLTYQLHFDKMASESEKTEPRYSELVEDSDGNLTTVLHLLLQADQRFAPVIATILAWYPEMKYITNGGEKQQTIEEMALELYKENSLSREAYDAIFRKDELKWMKSALHSGKLPVETLVIPMELRMMSFDVSVFQNLTLRLPRSKQRYEQGATKDELPQRNPVDGKKVFLLYNDTSQNKFAQRLHGKLQMLSRAMLTIHHSAWSTSNQVEDTKKKLECSDMLIILRSDSLSSFLLGQSVNMGSWIPPSNSIKIILSDRPIDDASAEPFKTGGVTVFVVDFSEPPSQKQVVDPIYRKLILQ